MNPIFTKLHNEHYLIVLFKRKKHLKGNRINVDLYISGIYFINAPVYETYITHACILHTLSKGHNQDFIEKIQ